MENFNFGDYTKESVKNAVDNIVFDFNVQISLIDSYILNIVKNENVDFEGRKPDEKFIVELLDSLKELKQHVVYIRNMLPDYSVMFSLDIEENNNKLNYYLYLIGLYIDILTMLNKYGLTGEPVREDYNRKKNEYMDNIRAALEGVKPTLNHDAIIENYCNLKYDIHTALYRVLRRLATEKMEDLNKELIKNKMERLLRHITEEFYAMLGINDYIMNMSFDEHMIVNRELDNVSVLYYDFQEIADKLKKS